MKVGFDKELYFNKQIKNILKRTELFSEKLYIEFGGKLLDDNHASRVLPGFDPDLKIKILETLKDKTEIIFCINSNHIEQSKIRADYNLTYDKDMLRQINAIRQRGIKVSAIVITLFTGQEYALTFKKKLENMGEKVYLHYPTKGYPNDVETIVSEQGYGKNDYIKTSMPIIVVTAPGPGSGKLATCLSQMYHESQMGINSGYAKYETFPIWNVPLKSPINLAYEAATLDLNDINTLDPYHYQAYGKVAVNYNRDIDLFPVIRAILEKITKKPDIYKSPTDMGVNMAGYAISDLKLCEDASRQEIIRRFYDAACQHKQGVLKDSALLKIQTLVNELKLKPHEDRLVAKVCMQVKNSTGFDNITLELPDGKLVTGKNKGLLTPSAAVVLNSVKEIANINDEIKLIPKNIIDPILQLYDTTLKDANSNKLTLHDALVALSLSVGFSDTSKKALEQLGKLRGCQAHASYILSESSVISLKKLGIQITMEPQFKNGYKLENNKINT